MSLLRKDFEREIKFPGPLKVGDSGNAVVQLQEWLCLHKYHTAGWNTMLARDKKFGAITESVLKLFQKKKGLKETGILDEATWAKLVEPMVLAFAKIKFTTDVSLADRTLAYMKQFVSQHPTELPDNCGPWVRAFMKGRDGSWAQWCNGVISTAIDHACDSAGKSMDKIFPWTWSCIESVNNTRMQKCSSVFFDRSKVDKGFEIKPGDLFIYTNPSGSPRHIGQIEIPGEEFCVTIEGNTNDEGSSNGYELCSLHRNIRNGRYHLIRISDERKKENDMA